jgi:aryl-alcohol dehydrogenase-like predicted oxidoreductase
LRRISSVKKVVLGNSGTAVSAICLGTMYFGSRLEEKASFEIMDAYYEHGGRLLDTAHNSVTRQVGRVAGMGRM